MQSPSDIEGLTERSRLGDREAASELFQLLYDELRRLARGYVRRERPGQSLQATGLVHEAYIRLARDANVRWNDREHFLALAARAMRQVLVERARARAAEKRGGGKRPITLVDAPQDHPLGMVDLLALDAALGKLAESDPRIAELVELRFFGGLTLDEAASAMSVSLASVKRWWAFAKAWLQHELQP